jgi:hypothetical protein
LDDFIGENKVTFNLMLWNKALSKVKITKSEENNKWFAIFNEMVEDFKKEMNDIFPWVEEVKNCEFLFGSGNENLTEFDMTIKNLIEELRSDISIKSLDEKLEHIIYEIDVEVERLKDKYKQGEIQNRLNWVKDFRMDLIVSQNYIKKLRNNISNKIIKAVRVQNEKQISEADQLPCDYLLLDTYIKDLYGGSGKIFQPR